MHRTARLTTGVLAVALAAGGAVAAAPASSAAAKVTKPIDCPKAFPTAKAVKGVVGTGFTVESGTKPAPFTATVLGRIKDGIQPGTDLIIARLSSPAVKRAHGIWAGISGSPVYAADGRLIGSTSYGLGINSDIAGLTPASALLPVLNGVGSARAAGPSRITLSPAQSRALADAGVPAATAATGFSRIPLPVSVAGKPTKQALAAVKALSDVRLVTGAARASGSVAKASQIHAGGNFVAAISYGDASFYAAGTTTVVCKGRAVAFGHPFFSDGATQMTAHGGSAVYVQPDSLFGAFKVVNPGGVAGVVDTDRTTGIRAVLGARPRTTAVTSSFRLGSHAAVKGSTTISYGPLTGLAAGEHVYLDAIRALGYEGRGSASMTFTIKGVRANGKAFSLTRKDAYADAVDLPAQLAQTVYSFVDPLVSQEFENLRITSVTVSGTLQTTVKRFSVAKIEARPGSRWVTLDSSAPLALQAGRALPVRVTLAPYKGVGSGKVVNLTVQVPAGTGSGYLEVAAGPTSPRTGQARSVTAILQALARARTGDTVVAQLYDANKSDPVSTATAHAGTAVAPYDDVFSTTVS